MYPLDFEEFLIANGFNAFEDIYENFIEKNLFPQIYITYC